MKLTHIIVNAEPSIEVPKEKLVLLNRSEADGEGYRHVDDDPGKGYIAMLSVVHELHCLVRWFSKEEPGIGRNGTPKLT